MEEQTKVCITCKEDKPLDQFSKLSIAKDGKQSSCKECNKIVNANFRKNRPKYQKKYYHTEVGRANKIKALNKSWDSLGAGVYKVTNKHTGEIYIGSSTQLNRRKTEWHAYLQQPDIYRKYMGEPLYNSAMKYGYDAFIWEIVEVIEDGTSKKVQKREYELIKILTLVGIKLFNQLGVLVGK